MWRWTACFVAGMLAHDANLISYGQDRLEVPLPAHCPGIRFEMAMGRITAFHLNAAQTRLLRGVEADSTVREAMHVNGEGPVPVVRYERHDSLHDVIIVITDGRELVMERKPLAEKSRAELLLQQRPNGWVEVTVGPADRRRRHSAPSFWHLLLAEPQLCEDEVIPLLHLLRPSWNFSNAAERLESALYRAAHSGQVVSRVRLAELVAELGHRDFQQRRLAEQQLRGYGPTVLPYLATIPGSEISAEQRYRIRHLLESLSQPTADDPERVAMWLVDDERIWLTLLRHSDPEKRHLAAIRLAEIRPETIHFDPYGDDHYREQQLARLKLVLLRR